MSVRTGEQTVRGTQLWKHRTGAGARNDDMDNTCELLINVVSASKPKMLTGLNQKGKGFGQSVRVSLCAIYDSPGGKADPKSSCKISGTW
ncbi:Uncharacterized protein dnl_55430 [Desulfonema limicola]|uniref:Uncharacterized protein n=1 Tax=Desulfonema limicola TaxID=45656 RepID=A0A975GJ60_9BACT|nr:Uncharacterized protein dnl_22540 [Desulfonema limicola]QTA79971.1 Uncharacterized protein dnl_22560 [Desulfonema limicola]QTA80643.1 Uncharacterized protein dnl_29540 [Desulfonema limicola]QTA80645.1 Uncharacterized protein dnl_29560 [Desulfonema limicola]QTA81305.1 Uncharacterized protein dnl_36380 [Desulfonema limicola]